MIKIYIDFTDWKNLVIYSIFQEIYQLSKTAKFLLGGRTKVNIKFTETAC